ncbi:sec-independent protein translocase protein TatB [Microbacterium endophyticum]|uniref:Sec-independent protein translocase protein TatB n=1 Tax=Microbacterium endophyticum TaxID=1526412 RepID=A0A7W4V261_9MICO|nr:Sec-independent protein translocase TatB [Microbacterium endophyticum]MBB2974778.1 sec-independent protein translocase protein TatB [Microbacterium endophyticum]NIK37075.1 sec-independent protein translocase protein TatB [Microbacterium endophyticum]
MIFGLTFEKLLVIAVIAGLIIGPDRLPRYAEGAARLIGQARDYLRGAKTRVRDEMGADFDDVDWRKLDPRQYDPRRIIREALLDDPPTATVKAVSAAAILSDPESGPETTRNVDGDFPYDDEAT